MTLRHARIPSSLTAEARDLQEACAKFRRAKHGIEREMAALEQRYKAMGEEWMQILVKKQNDLLEKVETALHLHIDRKQFFNLTLDFIDCGGAYVSYTVPDEDFVPESGPDTPSQIN